MSISPMISVPRRPRPFGHAPRNPNEALALEAWALGNIEDVVDASVGFIREHLITSGLEPLKAQRLSRDIAQAVLSCWAIAALPCGCCDWFRDDSTTAFMERKFDVRWPPDRT